MLVLLIYSFESGVLLQVPVSSIPVERVDIERISFRPGEITANLVNSGATDVEIAQLQVNDAIWGGTISPSSVIPRLGKATLSTQHPWIELEPVKLSVITSNGIKFEREIAVAVLTPEFSLQLLYVFVLIGIYIGLLPVFLGLGWYPILKSLSARWYDFFLSFTVGLLVLLGVDSVKEALKTSAEAPAVFNGTLLVVIGLFASFISLMTIGGSSISSKGGVARRGLALAYLISLGIGLHNLGEGLAVGAAYAVGEIALGAFLIIGFMIHNTTEGIAIVSPISSGKTSIKHIVAVGLIAGAPTIPGALLGGFSFSNLWASLFLAVGAGAIFQVVFEVLRYMADPRGLLSMLGDLRVFLGLTLGMLAMYLTSLLVTA